MHAEQIPLAQIVVPSERLRRVNPTAVDLLVENLRTRDLIYPIVVRQITGKSAYRLIAGGHRLDAFRALERETIPAIVRLADDTRAAQLEDEIEEIDENVVREEMQPGEVKLATKRRRQLFVELGALRRAEKAQLEYDETLGTKKSTRVDKEKARTRLNKALRAVESAYPRTKHGSVKGTQNKSSAGEFSRDTAKRHGITERAVQKRLSEADDIERVAEWAKVDARDVARSSIQSGRQLEAAVEIIEKYGREMVIEAGNVHALLKRHVRDAAKGADDVDIIKFKSSVDAELRRDELNEKRTKEEAERYKHAATLLMRARKAVLDAQDVMRAYKLKPRTLERLEQIKNELGTMADGLRVGAAN